MNKQPLKKLMIGWIKNGPYYTAERRFTSICITLSNMSHQYETKK